MVLSRASWLSYVTLLICLISSRVCSSLLQLDWTCCSRTSSIFSVLCITSSCGIDRSCMLAAMPDDDDERSWLLPAGLSDWRLSLCAGPSHGGASVADDDLCSVEVVLSLSEPNINNSITTTTTISLYHNCDSTTIRRYHDAFDNDGSDRSYDMRSTAIRLRYYDTTTTKNWRVHFFACVELEAGARDTS